MDMKSFRPTTVKLREATIEELAEVTKSGVTVVGTVGQGASKGITRLCQRFAQQSRMMLHSHDNRENETRKRK